VVDVEMGDDDDVDLSRVDPCAAQVEQVVVARALVPDLHQRSGLVVPDTGVDQDRSAFASHQPRLHRHLHQVVARIEVVRDEHLAVLVPHLLGHVGQELRRGEPDGPVGLLDPGDIDVAEGDAVHEASWNFRGAVGSRGGQFSGWKNASMPSTSER